MKVSFSTKNKNKEYTMDVEPEVFSRRQFDETWSRFCTDQVDQMVLLSEKNLSQEEYNEYLKEHNGAPYGECTYVKKRYKFKSGKELYLHVLECRWY